MAGQQNVSNVINSMMKIKQIIKNIELILLEWHCILEGHVWRETKFYYKCLRCRKRRKKCLK